MNLDSPCSCGLTVPGEELCANLAVLWAKDTLEETEPGQGVVQGEIFRIISPLPYNHRLPHLGGTLPPPP